MYDRDDGSRESWSVFYTPVEVFATKEMRDARIAYLSSRDPRLEFETCDELIMTDPNKFHEAYGDDGDEDGGSHRNGFLELIAEAAVHQATDLHLVIKADDK